MHETERELLSECRLRETWLKYKDMLPATYFKTADARKLRGVIARLHQQGKQDILPESWLKKGLGKKTGLDQPLPEKESANYVARTLLNSRTLHWQGWLEDQVEEGGDLDLTPMRVDLVEYERSLNGQISSNGSAPMAMSDVIKKKNWKKIPRTPTFLHEGLDEYLGGGVGPGELCVLQAPPKTGKSSFLYTIGYRAARAKIPTFIFSCENFTDQVGERIEQIHKANGGTAKNFPKNLWFDYKYQPCLADLERMVSQLPKVGMLVVDYVDNMRATRTDGPDFVWTIDELYDGIRHLAAERGAIAWTATQATDPPSPWMKRSTRKQTYGSDKKIQKCDFFLGIQAHPQDDTATLTVLGRRGRGKVGEDFEVEFVQDTCSVVAID